MNVLHILFVCTGNICRSPTAERLAAAHAARLQLSDVIVSSAGTHAVIGHEIHPYAAEVLMNHGGQATGFRARQLNKRIASSSDLILTMTSKHRDAVLQVAPQCLRRTFTLDEAALLISNFGAACIADLAKVRPQLAAADVVDIPDPMGHGEQVFAVVGEEIAKRIVPVLELCAKESASGSIGG